MFHVKHTMENLRESERCQISEKIRFLKKPQKYKIETYLPLRQNVKVGISVEK